MAENPIINAWEEVVKEPGGYDVCQEFIDHLIKRYGDNVNYFLMSGKGIKHHDASSHIDQDTDLRPRH